MADKNLTVKIRGDNRGLGKSLASSKAQVNKFGGFLKGFGARFGVLGAGLVGTAGVAGAVKLFTSATADIDKLAKLGKQFGFSVEQMQVFERVAKLTGTNLEQLLKGFGNLTKSIIQFARDGTGPGAKVFKDLGLGAEQLEKALKTGPVAVLKVVGAALKKIDDPLRRSALTEELLGARNKELAVALADVTKEFGRAAKEIRTLALALTPEETKVVEDYNDAWTRVFNTIQNRARKAAAELSKELLPAVESFEEALNNFLKGEGGLGGFLAADVAKPLGRALLGAEKTARGTSVGQFLQGNPIFEGFMAQIRAAGSVLEGSAGEAARVLLAAHARIAIRGAGQVTGFPLSARALDMALNPRRAVPAPGTGTINGKSIADILSGGPAVGQMQRGTPFPGGMAPGTGTINGKSIDGILKESQAQTGLLKGISESFIINERTGVRTAVAAP